MITSLKLNRYLLEILRQYVTFLVDEEFPPIDKIIVQNNTTQNSVKPEFTFINDGWILETPSLCFKRLNNLTDYTPAIKKQTTRGLFGCATNEKLETFFTGSVLTNQEKYYMSVYDKNINDINSHHEFDITYGHISGSGSSYSQVDGTYTTQFLPAKTMFRKYMLECFDRTDGKFEFKNGVNGDYFYAIHFDRDSFKDRLDPGNFQITLSPIVSNPNQLYNTGSNFYFNTASNTIFTLIDDSSDAKEQVTYMEDVKDHYYLVSGSLLDGVYDEIGSNAWGVVFPKKGLIILDGAVLDQSCSFNTVTASIEGDNIKKLFYSISGSTAPTDARTNYGSWFARSSEYNLVETYFCRVRPSEMTYSNNPTYSSGSNNELRYTSPVDDSFAYITTIGLYNNKRELIAVGKVEKPILKKKNDECIFQVRVRTN
jgi:hypothetical protein